jgi:hypothetical protein
VAKVELYAKYAFQSRTSGALGFMNNAKNCKRASCEIARDLLLRNLLGTGSVFLLLACGGRLCLFLRRRLAGGFRRLVAHKPNAKMHGNRRQLKGRERSQCAPAPIAQLSGNNTRGHSRAISSTGSKRPVSELPLVRTRVSTAIARLSGAR